ncbi:MAG: hypothetical protein RSO15_14795 [Bacteroides sp.]|uniref:hypothetical protein n=1 Tax=Bacteroides sp. TaxID=29523 RepID=UPI002FCA648B
MEKIIQLKESEYNKLFESANLKESEVERMAKEMYEKKGTFSINLELDCKQDYQDTITLKAYSYVKDWDGKYPLSEKDKRRIADFVDYRATKMMEKKFGRQITNINLWNTRLDLLRNWKLKFIGLTIFGWLAALALLLIALLNKNSSNLN